ncbi:MAG: iron ABC transporter permease [Nitrospira sp.]|nr:iron ABC transporter permease [Nitrospira sp.]
MPNGQAAPLSSTASGGSLSDSAVQSAVVGWARSGAILTSRRRWLVLIGLLVASVVVMCFCSGFGAAKLSSRDLLAAIGSLLTTGRIDGAVDDTVGAILFQVRLPRVLMGFLVGGTLAIVGATLQALLRNALADPYVLGVSSGAALGVALAMLLGMGTIWVVVPVLPLWGFAGGVTALMLIYRLAQSHGHLPIHSLLLAGVILNAMLTAVIMFITSIMDPARSTGLIMWLMGSLTPPSWVNLIGIALYVTAGTLVLLYQAPALNVLTQGEDTARSLGINTEGLKRRLYVLTALLTGAVVAVSGMIGFIGMVIPHAVRMAIGSDHRLLMPASAFVGGMFLVLSDTVARTAFAPAEIPVGVVTALAGGPVFLYLLLWRKDRMT